jgi:hypothetical protein
MPGFVVARSVLDGLSKKGSGDIPVGYITGWLAPLGSIFAAGPRDLCDLLKKSGMKSFRSGKLVISGAIPPEVLADLDAHSKGLFAPGIATAKSPDHSLSARAATAGSGAPIGGAPIMPHDMSHVTQHGQGRKN